MTDEQTDKLTAYKALRLLARKSLAGAQQLPAQVDAIPQWSGIGFILLGHHFVISMGDLNEMLEVPTFTRLPGVQSWVKGVANVRGRLLPVFDLAAYFGGCLQGHKKQQRLLVLDRDQVYAGLWVDQVLGMQYFPVDTQAANLPDDLPGSIKPFVGDGFSHAGRVWTVFYPLSLLDDKQFMDVAAV